MENFYGVPPVGLDMQTNPIQNNSNSEFPFNLETYMVELTEIQVTQATIGSDPSSILLKPYINE